MSAAAAEFMKDTPMYQLYHRVAPRPEDFGQILDKIGEYMAQPFDLRRTCADSRCRRCSSAPMPTWRRRATSSKPSGFLTAACGTRLDGRDRPKGGHALAILPGLTHYNSFSSPLFAAATLAFLEEQES